VLARKDLGGAVESREFKVESLKLEMDGDFGNMRSPLGARNELKYAEEGLQ
jgi:hypothetical protein